MLAAVPLFYQDVLPILEKHCQSCHRAGEAAPMALQAYEQVRPYARAIRDSVLRHTMPPWFANSAPGAFANDPRALISRLVASSPQTGDMQQHVWQAIVWNDKAVAFRGVEPLDRARDLENLKSARLVETLEFGVRLHSRNFRKNFWRIPHVFNPTTLHC